MGRAANRITHGVVACAFLAGCYGGEGIDQSVEELNVCHTTTVEGLDVSEFQRTIDWNAVHASGREFAIARAGDGTYHDPTFARNWAGMRAAGMIRGAYIFWRPSSDPNAMGDLIRDAVGHLGAGDLPVTIDVECMCPASARVCTAGGPGCVAPAAATANLRAVIARVTADTGRAPMIYTGTWFWDGGSYLAGAARFPGNALWVSGYINGCVSVPSGWTDWQIWQYSDGTCAGCPVRNTPVPGVASSPSVDRDRFNGTLAQLRALANMAPATPDWAAHYVAQSFPLAAAAPLMMRAGESLPAYIEMRNVGGHAWDGRVRLATTQPRDRRSAFAASDWVAPNRPSSVTGTITPNNTFRFNFTLHAPMMPGTYSEYFGMVVDGVTWFSDPAQGGPADNLLQARITVTAAPPPPDAGVRDAGAPDVTRPDVIEADLVDPDVSAPDDGNVEDAGADEASVDDASEVGAVTDGAARDGATGAAPDGGCGCRTGAPSRGSLPALLAIGAALATSRRRRRC